MFVVVLLLSAALASSSVALMKSRARDKEAALEEIQRTQAQAVAQCESFNQSRKNTYDSNMALMSLVVLNSSSPTELPRLIVQFIDFTKSAFEPVSCDPTDPNFGKDVTPPTPIEAPLITR